MGSSDPSDSGSWRLSMCFGLLASSCIMFGCAALPCPRSCRAACFPRSAFADASRSVRFAGSRGLAWSSPREGSLI